MIEKVLEAFEVESSKNNSFFIRLRRMNNIIKFLLVLNIVFAIILYILLFWFQNILVYLLIILYFAGTNIEIAVIERLRHKEWEKNIGVYNKELDIISEILKREEFNLYEKVKIKQLICKFNQAIERGKQKNNSKRSEIQNFLLTCVFPIVAFFVGKINPSLMSTETEWIAIGIVIIGIVFLFRYGYKNLVDFIKMIGWDTLEKEEIFVLKLQDLLDRDFIIEQDDLISSK